jgi:UDP-N-acetylglucosamine:LPS N-acetylglucosamine transferase
MSFLNTAFADDKLFIVANQTALGLAKDFLTSMNNESIPLSIVMDQFDKVKKEKYIIVLGGAKGAGSVEDFVKQVLTSQERESGNQPGGKLFVKENVFAQGQVIIVFTGPDEAAAADARKKSRNTWWQYLAKWFELDTSNPMIY